MWAPQHGKPTRERSCCKAPRDTVIVLQHSDIKDACGALTESHCVQKVQSYACVSVCTPEPSCHGGLFPSDCCSPASAPLCTWYKPRCKHIWSKCAFTFYVSHQCVFPMFSQKHHYVFINVHFIYASDNTLYLIFKGRERGLGYLTRKHGKALRWEAVWNHCSLQGTKVFTV